MFWKTYAHLELEELHSRLKNTFNEKNLTTITTALIDAFREKRYSYIQSLKWCLHQEAANQDDNVNKLFAHLIRQVHPDRLNYYHREIDCGFQKKDRRLLLSYTFLLVLLDELSQDASETHIDAEIRESMEDEYWYQEEDFDQIFDADNESAFHKNGFLAEDELDNIRSFLTVLNEKEGDPDMIIESYHLKNLTGELDLSGMGINDLFGIEHCRNLTGLDLSANHLFDIIMLGSLHNLEELYLSGNSIQSISALADLRKLKILDLSNNDIDDISVLKDLPNLEFVNLTGNPVSQKHLSEARRKGLVVLS
jgi:hypothetical protein